MEKLQFENILASVCETLTDEIQISDINHKPSLFEKRVREEFKSIFSSSDHHIAKNINQGFPDIVIGDFGVEVKATESNSWRCIANSVSEGHRSLDAKYIYLIYGKMGGTPEVQWASYGESIVHVRTSHVPRFEVEIGAEHSLFEHIDMTYEEFRVLPMDQKMPFIREYARNRLKPGDRLWWLENTETDNQNHSLPLDVKVYMDLTQTEKKRLRAEAALMCPQIVGGRGLTRKYVDAALYLMTYRGVLCPQARDLFSAGSVAGKSLGGSYVLRGLINIQQEMRDASEYLEDALFEEYWGLVPPKNQRIKEWLKKSDRFADKWIPSENLFLEDQS